MGSKVLIISNTNELVRVKPERVVYESQSQSLKIIWSIMEIVGESVQNVAMSRE